MHVDTVSAFCRAIHGHTEGSRPWAWAEETIEQLMGKVVGKEGDIQDNHTQRHTALCAGMPLIIVFTSRLIHLMHTFYIKTNESEITDKQPVIID